ncbi:hypothetical protein Ahu01nite_079200 [Winogradskya humida]|uniref:Sulfatase-modifying factor enzyme 1 n=1 Tax=Winogradskya humida TaxID=113566 RepID=A0ABQ4A2H1_9ACTN|nr:hypothetical protein Ahu01nite_079200 [Actinoplanes humidus]
MGPAVTSGSRIPHIVARDADRRFPCGRRPPLATVMKAGGYYRSENFVAAFSVCGLRFGFRRKPSGTHFPILKLRVE